MYERQYVINNFPPSPFGVPYFITIATMLAAAFLCCAFALAGILHSLTRFGLWDLRLAAHTTPPSANSENENSKYRITCGKIADAVSSASQVYYPGESYSSCARLYPHRLRVFILFFLGSQKFDSGISHWVNSSSQIPACSVEPGTPSDVGLIVNWSFCQHTLTLSLTFEILTTGKASGDRSSSCAIRYQGWRSFHQPRLFVNTGHTHIYDPIPGYCRS